MKLWQKIWQSLKWPLLFVGVLVFMAIFADFLANEKPIYANYHGRHYFPVLSTALTDTIIDSSGNYEVVVFKSINWDESTFIIRTPIPYGYKTVDKNNRLTSPLVQHFQKDSLNNKISSPFYYRHHLGTDNQGHDLLARLIHGSRVSLLVSVLAVLLAAVIGILIGTFAGFWGDHKLKMSLSSFILLGISLPFAFYYAFILRQYTLATAANKGLTHFIPSLFISLIIGSVIIFLFQGIARLLIAQNIGSRQIKIPLDSTISRVIELLDSLPKLMLLLTIAVIFKPSLYLLALVIGFTGWTGIARFVRAEVLRLSELDYIQAGHALGFSTGRIMLKHIIPHALTPIWIILAFAIGDVIVVEAALSFIDIGIPDDVVSWGKLLPDKPLEAWWLALFPGLAIFFTVLMVNITGEKLRDVLDPKDSG